MLLFSPRMRGCFCRSVFFRRSIKVLPAYAGMFPYFMTEAENSSKFSPRMRGCFQRSPLSSTCPQVLPAYAGMFPRLGSETGADGGSPRVCGDVSSHLITRKRIQQFSPRMRGCFRYRSSHRRHLQVLPAYAGMFLSLETS